MVAAPESITFPAGFSKGPEKGVGGVRPGTVTTYNIVYRNVKIIFYQTPRLPNGILEHGYKNSAESDRESRSGGGVMVGPSGVVQH